MNHQPGLDQPDEFNVINDGRASRRPADDLAKMNRRYSGGGTADLLNPEPQAVHQKLVEEIEGTFLNLASSLLKFS